MADRRHLWWIYHPIRSPIHMYLLHVSESKEEKEDG